MKLRKKLWTKIEFSMGCRSPKGVGKSPVIPERQVRWFSRILKIFLIVFNSIQGVVIKLCVSSSTYSLFIPSSFLAWVSGPPFLLLSRFSSTHVMPLSALPSILLCTRHPKLLYILLVISQLGFLASPNGSVYISLYHYIHLKYEKLDTPILV